MVFLSCRSKLHLLLFHPLEPQACLIPKINGIRCCVPRGSALFTLCTPENTFAEASISEDELRSSFVYLKTYSFILKQKLIKNLRQR
jgi:hypothetical protein